MLDIKDSSDETKKFIINSKTQVEEAKRIEELLRIHLN
jgi:hypothetical protein